MRVCVFILICFLLASCSTGSIRFIPENGGSIRTDGAEIVASRYVITFFGGKINNDDEMVGYSHFALSIPPDTKVSKRIELLGGGDRLLRFTILSGQLIIEDVKTRTRFSVLLSDFGDSSSATIRKIQAEEIILFSDVKVYIKSDAGSKNR